MVDDSKNSRRISIGTHSSKANIFDRSSGVLPFSSWTAMEVDLNSHSLTMSTLIHTSEDSEEFEKKLLTSQAFALEVPRESREKLLHIIQ